MRSTADLAAWLAARGGAAHSGELKAAGFTTHGIRVAVHEGDAERVRRSWLVTRGCAPELRRAAEVGGRLTCVSAAAFARLWTPAHEHIHLAVPSTSSRHDADGVRLHWGRGPAPVGARALVDPMPNVPSQVARCLPMPDARCVWESAIRQKAIAAGVLCAIRWSGEAARALAAVASHLSDSGVETLRLPPGAVRARAGHDGALDLSPEGAGAERMPRGAARIHSAAGSAPDSAARPRTSSTQASSKARSFHEL